MNKPINVVVHTLEYKRGKENYFLQLTNKNHQEQRPKTKTRKSWKDSRHHMPSQQLF